MKRLRCIIVEDSQPAQEILRIFIERTANLKLVEIFSGSMEALNFLKCHEIDLVFLDIQLPGMNGVELIKSLDKPPQIIVTSAYSKNTLDAFDIGARDYLLKPFSYERFLRSISRVPLSGYTQASGLINPDQRYGFYNVNKTMVRVMYNTVIFVEGMRDYIYIHTEEGTVVTKASLRKVEGSLPHHFIRIHRSFIVNIEKITAYNSEEVFIKKRSLPIGPNYKKVIHTIFGEVSEES